MRVLQLIDSLRPGGAEKMAVNIANALVPHIEKSYLCCTRTEGSLRKDLKPDVIYFFLNKKSRFDLKAIIKIKKFIQENAIDIVHTHGTSFFLPSLIKFSGINFKLIWHIHNGGTINSSYIDQKVVTFFSKGFDGIIAVNSLLKDWASNRLFCTQVIECKNFIVNRRLGEESRFSYKGDKDCFKIICLANLRPEKGHINLLNAFEKMELNIKCSLHLIGALPENFEKSEIYKTYLNSVVKDAIHFYGVQEDISEILKGADLGVITSDFEGLPLALLEYGYAGLPVVVTDVGLCREIVGEDALIIPPKNSSALSRALDDYINDPEKRKKDAVRLQQKIMNNYSEQKVFPYILAFYKEFVD